MAIDWILTLQDDIAELKDDIATLVGVRDDLVAACERLDQWSRENQPGEDTVRWTYELNRAVMDARAALAKAKAGDAQEARTAESDAKRVQERQVFCDSGAIIDLFCSNCGIRYHARPTDLRCPNGCDGVINDDEKTRTAQGQRQA